MVEEKDLKGQIAEFPLSVVKEMVANQVRQGNTENVEVFQDNASSSKMAGGFDWNETPEGYNYWKEVIICKNFSVKEKHNYIIPSMGDVINVTRLDGRKVEDVVCIGYLPILEYPVLYVTKKTWQMMRDNDPSLPPNPNIYVGKVENKVRLTLKDISEGKGVGVDPSLIEIVM